MDELVSIIVPVFNGEKYIGRCLESLIAQTYSKTEIIVIDDGSTDNSAGMVEGFVNQYSNILLVRKSNGGVATARNIGIEKAQGDFLMFVDADDCILSKDFLEQLLKCAEYDYIVAGITNRVFSNDERYSDNENVLEEAFGESIESLPSTFFINGFVHTSCSKIYKRSIINKNHIRFPQVRLSEDSFFNIDYIKHIQNWAIISAASYCYIRNYSKENATAKFYSSDVDIYVKLYEAMKQLPIESTVINKVIYAQFLAMSLKCVKSTSLCRREKKKQLMVILQQPHVRSILRQTRTNKGERITGWIISTGNLTLYACWEKVLKCLDK